MANDDENGQETERVEKHAGSEDTDELLEANDREASRNGGKGESGRTSDEQLEEDRQTLEDNRERRIDGRQEALRSVGETARSAEDFVTENESRQESILQEAQDLGNDNQDNQVELDGKLKDDFHRAVEFKREFETETVPGWFQEVALDEEQIADLTDDSAERLTLQGSTKNPVSVQDGLRVVEADLVNRGVFGEARGQYKGLFDNHLEETGERNDPVAEVASNRARNSEEARGHYESHRSEFSGTVDEFLNETLENPQEGSSTMQVLASNMADRVVEYEEIKSGFETVVEEWSEAQTEEDVNVPEGATDPQGAVDSLRDMIGALGGRSEIDTTQREEVEKAWAWYRTVAADSMNEQLQRMQGFKQTLEGVREDFEDAKDQYVEMQDDVEDLDQLANVGENVEELLNDHGYETILDIADRENGGDFLNAFDLSPFNSDLDEGVGPQLKEEGGDVIYDSAVEAAQQIAEKYGFDQLTSQVEGIIGDEEGTDVMQLAGAYEQASEFINVVSDMIERVETELDEYAEEVQGEDVDEYVQSELEDSYDELNSYLAEEDQISVGELPDDPQDLFDYDLGNVEA